MGKGSTMIGKLLSIGLTLISLSSETIASDFGSIMERLKKDRLYESNSCDSYLAELTAEERALMKFGANEVVLDDFVRAALGLDSFVGSYGNFFDGLTKKAIEISGSSPADSKLISAVRASHKALQKGASQKHISKMEPIWAKRPMSVFYMFCIAKEADIGLSSLTHQIDEQLSYIEERPRMISTDHFIVSVSNCEATKTLSKAIQLAPEPWDDSRFFVIDAKYKNTDGESRIPFEGSLFITYQGKEYKYDAPEPILDNRYGLRLHPINPLLSLKTKIVYRIPNELEGEVFWQPGRNPQAKRLWCGTLKASK